MSRQEFRFGENAARGLFKPEFGIRLQGIGKEYSFQAASHIRMFLHGVGIMRLHRLLLGLLLVGQWIQPASGAAFDEESANPTVAAANVYPLTSAFAALPSTVRLSGRVVADATGEPVPFAKISIPERIITADDKGEFDFGNVPGMRESRLNLRVLDQKGDIIGCAFVQLPVDLYPVAADSPQGFAIRIAHTEADANLELRVIPLAGDALNIACSECHPPNPCVADLTKPDRWDPITHLGGFPVQEKELSDFQNKLLTEGVTPEMYENLRYRDIHPHDTDLRKFVLSSAAGRPPRYHMPDELPLDGGDRITCDTCHTRHMPTAFPAFCHMTFVERSLLCEQCHK